jgi:hypothetical protein
MDDGREALNEIDRTLAEALDVDVSPDFMARVRRRIADEPMRAPFWQGWRLVVPAAAAAGVLVAVAVSMLSTRGPAVPPSLTARSLPIESTQPAGARPAPPVRTSETPRAIARVRVEPGAPAVSAPPEPEVLVPREEIEMYRRLIAQAQNVPGALLVAAPPDIVAGRSISEIPIDLIKIDLIIPSVPSVDGEGDRQ